MASPLIQPNWHAVIIHYPLALLTLGVAVEVFSVFWRRSTVRAAARWMMLLGALGLLPALATGMYAFRSVVAPGSDDESPWSTVAARSHWTPEQWDLMRDHILLGGVGAAAAVLVAILYLGAGEATRQRWRLAFLGVFVLATAAIVASAWHGGELVYDQGTAVNVTRAAAAPTTTATAHRWALDRYVAPLDLHLTLVGLTVAAAVGAIGTTWRRFKLWTVVEQTEARVERDADRAIAEAVGTKVTEAPPPGMVYPTRVWLLTLVLAAGAAAAGVWAAGDTELETARSIVTQPSARANLPRLAAHLAFGSVILLLPLVLALMTAVVRRGRLIANLIILLLLLAVAGQVWVGTLMLFDSVNGPVTGWNGAGAGPTSAPAGARE